VTYRAALDRLYSLEYAGIKLGLDNIRKLCATLGNPQTQYISIHVAGTNGKGSVCAVLDSILRAAGYRVGRFTSPHLRDFRERIHLDGQPISRARIVSFIERHWSMIRRNGYSYFEATTALAFESFARAGIDIAVVEVGLGGRLDATGILPSSVSVITRIARDHERILGRTPRLIAREKAGIIRSGVPVVTGPLWPEADRVIRRTAEQVGAPLWSAHEILASADGADWLPRRGERWQTSMLGEHQTTNIATALAAVALLPGAGVPLPRHAIRQGVRNVHWPGRFQSVGRHPSIIFDAAHNRDSARALAVTWRRVFGHRRAVTLFTTRADKDYRRMTEALAPHMSEWIGCPLPTVTGIDRATMARLARRLQIPFTWFETPQQAYRETVRRAGRGLALVAGSHFLIGAVIPATAISDQSPGRGPTTMVTRRDILRAAGCQGAPF
jgi:dihydrofolate synthase/folylpolyglutamate synthase